MNRKLSHRSLLAGAVALAVLSAGCAASRKAAWEDSEGSGGGGAGAGPATSAASSPADAAAAAAAEGDRLWAERGDLAKLQAAIAAWERATGLNAKDWQTFEKLSHAYYFLADGHYSFGGDAEKEKYLGAFEKGISAAERGLLAVSPRFEEKARAAGKEFKVHENGDLIPKEGVGLLYWYSTNLGKWALAKGFSTILARKDEAKTIMERVLALDPKFYYGAPDRYFGTYYAKTPSFAGGDMKKAGEHFKRSIEIAPDYLATHVLFAEFYATGTDDRAAFEKALKRVLDAPENIIPGFEPEARVEKRKAKKLLDRIDEEF